MMKKISFVIVMVATLSIPLFAQPPTTVPVCPDGQYIKFDATGPTCVTAFDPAGLIACADGQLIVADTGSYVCSDASAPNIAVSSPFGSVLIDPGAGTKVAVNGGVYASAGTVGTGFGVYGTCAEFGGTATTCVGVRGDVSGTPTNGVGGLFWSAGADNNTSLLIQNPALALPTGDYAIYSASTDSSYLSGPLTGVILDAAVAGVDIQSRATTGTGTTIGVAGTALNLGATAEDVVGGQFIAQGISGTADDVFGIRAYTVGSTSDNSVGAAFQSDGGTSGNTDLLLGTLTPPAGDYAIYSASTDQSTFNGDITAVGAMSAVAFDKTNAVTGNHTLSTGTPSFGNGVRGYINNSGAAVTDARGFWGGCDASSGTTTNCTGLHIIDGADTGLTNRYGVQVEEQAGASGENIGILYGTAPAGSTDYAIYSASTDDSVFFGGINAFPSDANAGLQGFNTYTGSGSTNYDGVTAAASNSGTGTVLLMEGVSANAITNATRTTTTAIGVRGVTSDSGTTTNAIGGAFDAANTGSATNETDLLLGTLTPVAGDYAIYSASTDDSVLLGDLWFDVSSNAGISQNGFGDLQLYGDGKEQLQLRGTDIRFFDAVDMSPQGESTGTAFFLGSDTSNHYFDLSARSGQNDYLLRLNDNSGNGVFVFSVHSTTPTLTIGEGQSNSIIELVKENSKLAQIDFYNNSVSAANLYAQIYLNAGERLVVEGERDLYVGADSDSSGATGGSVILQTDQTDRLTVGDDEVTLADGHIVIGSTDPTLSACGTTPSVAGADTAGRVTIGTGTTTSCTVTFASAFTAAPACVVTGSDSAVTYAATTTTTALTVTSSADMASDVVMYHCFEVS